MSKKKKRIPSQSLPDQPLTRCPIFEAEFREDLKFLARTNPASYDEVWRLIDECLDHPLTETGKPEPLKYLGTDLWSRRVTVEPRRVYRVGNAKVSCLTCRHHY